jgi:hypothetical protein
MFCHLRSFFTHLSNLVAFRQLVPGKRQIVFYSEGKTYWVHLSALLQQLLTSSDVGVCYISSGKDDPGLQIRHPNLSTFLIDEGPIRNWLFENMETDIMVMTMPDLNQFQVKRSRNPVHYVYTQHSLVSFHMVYRPGAFDHFDTIFCSGPHHLVEIQAMEKAAGLPGKNLVRHGYPRLDEILRSRGSAPVKNNSRRHILIAPSWGEHSITDTVAADLIGQLLECDYRITFRPHPQSLKFSAQVIKKIVDLYGGQENFSFESDVTGTNSLLCSDIMISDWSGAALDYAFGLEKPVLFVDVPRKINNPHYQEIDIEPFEVGVRSRIGAVMPPGEISEVNSHIEDLLRRDMTAEIRAVREQYVFNAGGCEVTGAIALLDILSPSSRASE